MLSLDLYNMFKIMKPRSFGHPTEIIYIYIYMGWGEFRFNCWRVRWPGLMLFLFNVNVSGIRPGSRFSS